MEGVFDTSRLVFAHASQKPQRLNTRLCMYFLPVPFSHRPSFLLFARPRPPLAWLAGVSSSDATHNTNTFNTNTSNTNTSNANTGNYTGAHNNTGGNITIVQDDTGGGMYDNSTNSTAGPTAAPTPTATPTPAPAPAPAPTPIGMVEEFDAWYGSVQMTPSAGHTMKTTNGSRAVGVMLRINATKMNTYSSEVRRLPANCPRAMFVPHTIPCAVFVAPHTISRDNKIRGLRAFSLS